MCSSPLSSSSDLIVGGATAQAHTSGTATAQDLLLAVNANSGRVVRSAPAEAPIAHLRRSARMVCAGTSGGAIQLRDPRSLSIEGRITAHHGGLIDMQAEGNVIYSIGWTLRQGRPVAEPLIKAFDLRNLASLVPVPLTAPGGPALLAIHPKRTSTLAVATPQAQFQILDTHDAGQSQFYSMNSHAFITSMAFSPSAEVLAFGESDNSLRLWSNTHDGAARFNAYPTAPVALPDVPAAGAPHLPWSSVTPLSCVGMPHYSTQLLSAMPADDYWGQASPLFNMPRRAALDALDNVHTVASVGYAPLPRHLRGHRNEVVQRDDLLARYDKTGKLKRSAIANLNGSRADRRVHMPLFRSERSSTTPAAAHETGEDAWDTDAAGMPGYYRLMMIQYSRFGVEDFDFGFYNKTRFSGLESNIDNAYANAYLQGLFYSMPFRDFATRHILMPCTSDECLLCEAGFLFRNLEDAKGTNCQATNFLSTFSHNRKAAALQLMDTDEANTNAHPYSQLAQSLNHFALDHVSFHAQRTRQDAALGERGAALCRNPCAWTSEARSTCARCGGTSSRMHTSHVVDLVYPRHGTPSFAALVEASMVRETPSKGTCRHCRTPNAPHQTRRMLASADALPAVLSVNACASTEEQLRFWAAAPRRGARTGRTATWVPRRFALAVRDGLVRAQTLDEGAEPAPDAAVYEVRALVVQIQGAQDPPHLCTLVRDPGDAAGAEAWFLFNDFLVRQVDEAEAREFGVPWKIPAVLLFERVDAAARAERAALAELGAALRPDTELLLRDENLAANRDVRFMRHRPLTREELPAPGALVAIDAEFVSLQLEELEVYSDGTRSLIRPSCLALARVSVLRGEGPAEGEPFIDDHIWIQEPVVDYLTQFSGVQPGDLDVNRSRYTVVPRKTAYKKLRMLVDMGCRFIGHGLAKDFRTINIFVPPQQVVDTVTLYHSPVHQRNLSLRFLAWFLLKQDIQSGAVVRAEDDTSKELVEGHDSIQDADAALKLYRRYEIFQRDDRLEDVLEDLYEVGPRVNWRPPVRTDT